MAAVAELPIPQIADDEVLVAARSVGVCHSDIDLLEGRYIIPFSYPLIPGHEWSGEVVAVGAKVTGVGAGRPGGRGVRDRRTTTSASRSAAPRRSSSSPGPSGCTGFPTSCPTRWARWSSRSASPTTRSCAPAASTPATPSSSSGRTGRSGRRGRGRCDGRAWSSWSSRPRIDAGRGDAGGRPRRRPDDAEDVAGRA